MGGIPWPLIADVAADAADGETGHIWEREQVPVFHFIFHAYRSWGADHPDGYRQHGQRGLIPPDPGIARYRDRLARSAEVVFTAEMQTIFVATARQACSRREWRLHAIVATPTHVHAVVSWKSNTSESEVTGSLKRLMSREAGKYTSDGLKRRFSRGASCTRIKNRSHLTELIHEYLPEHTGVYWREEVAEEK